MNLRTKKIIGWVIGGVLLVLVANLLYVKLRDRSDRRALDEGKEAGDAQTLIAVLDSHNYEYRKEAVQELAKLRDKSAVAPLIELLFREPKYEVRKVCIGALAVFDEKRIVDAFMKKFSEETAYPVRTGIIKALGEITNERNKTLLKTIARTAPDTAARANALLILLIRYPGKDLSSTAQEALASPFPDVRKKALRIAAAIHDETLLDSVIAVLHNDTESSVRAAAARALGKLRTIQSADALATALATNKSPRVRKAILESLEYLTGQKLGTNAARWREWLQLNPELPPPQKEKPPEMPPEEGIPPREYE